MKALVKNEEILLCGAEIVQDGNNFREITGNEIQGCSVNSDLVRIIETNVIDNTSNLKDYKYDTTNGVVIEVKSRKWSKKDFGSMLLTGQELLDLDTASKTDAEVFQVKYALETTEYIDLDDWLTKKALDIMIAKGLLTEERKNEILAGKIIAEM